jgi:hypothetical protein
VEACVPSSLRSADLKVVVHAKKVWLACHQENKIIHQRKGRVLCILNANMVKVNDTVKILRVKLRLIGANVIHQK